MNEFALLTPGARRKNRAGPVATSEHSLREPQPDLRARERRRPGTGWRIRLQHGPRADPRQPQPIARKPRVQRRRRRVFRAGEVIDHQGDRFGIPAQHRQAEGHVHGGTVVRAGRLRGLERAVGEHVAPGGIDHRGQFHDDLFRIVAHYHLGTDRHIVALAGKGINQGDRIGDFRNGRLLDEPVHPQGIQTFPIHMTRRLRWMP